MEKTDKTKSVLGTTARYFTAVILFIAVCFITFETSRFMSRKSKQVYSSVDSGNMLPVIVIDPGHGGIDSGAVGVDGSLEKELNLSVAKRLYDLFTLVGYECVMTRDTDTMLVDDSIKEHRKMHDLKNRLEVANGYFDDGRDVIFLSIHMNKFSLSEYSGLQVWYSSGDEKSRELAGYIQSYASTWLDPDNHRDIKKATSSIYVLDHARMPAVLVECGFLSNADECARLGTEEYQTKTALTIFSAVCDMLG